MRLMFTTTIVAIMCGCDSRTGDEIVADIMIDIKSRFPGMRADLVKWADAIRNSDDWTSVVKRYRADMKAVGIIDAARNGDDNVCVAFFVLDDRRILASTCVAILAFETEQVLANQGKIGDRPYRIYEELDKCWYLMAYEDQD